MNLKKKVKTYLCKKVLAYWKKKPFSIAMPKSTQNRQLIFEMGDWGSSTISILDFFLQAPRRYKDIQGAKIWGWIHHISTKTNRTSSVKKVEICIFPPVFLSALSGQEQSCVTVTDFVCTYMVVVRENYKAKLWLPAYWHIKKQRRFVCFYIDQHQNSKGIFFSFLSVIFWCYFSTLWKFKNLVGQFLDNISLKMCFNV